MAARRRGGLACARRTKREPRPSCRRAHARAPPPPPAASHRRRRRSACTAAPPTAPPREGAPCAHRRRRSCGAARKPPRRAAPACWRARETQAFAKVLTVAPQRLMASGQARALLPSAWSKPTTLRIRAKRPSCRAVALPSRATLNRLRAPRPAPPWWAVARRSAAARSPPRGRRRPAGWPPTPWPPQPPCRKPTRPYLAGRRTPSRSSGPGSTARSRPRRWRRGAAGSMGPPAAATAARRRSPHSRASRPAAPCVPAAAAPPPSRVAPPPPVGPARSCDPADLRPTLQISSRDPAPRPAPGPCRSRQPCQPAVAAGCTRSRRRATSSSPPQHRAARTRPAASRTSARARWHAHPPRVRAHRALPPHCRSHAPRRLEGVRLLVRRA
eukprot:scaffold14937_cov57-Phaeocystis_antarctica.AAC.8